MTKHTTSCQETTFGYVSTLESVEHGFFGGYLVISDLGRPLEFHCTAPVKPSRAQEILYGPTLQAYLLGEQIGGTLLQSAELTPSMVLTDQPALLALRSHSKVPLVHVAEQAAAPDAGAIASAAAATGMHSPTRRFSHAGCNCELPVGFESDMPLVLELLTALAKRVDVLEPLGRIHEAIREAQRIGGEGSDGHAQAA